MREGEIIKNITKMFGVDAGIKTAKLLYCWDGGEGSGNFNHAGNPPNRGGSGKGGESGKPVSKQESGVKLAEKYRKDYYDAPRTYKPKGFNDWDVKSKENFISDVYRNLSYTEIRKMTPEQQDALFDNYLNVLEHNGDPGKTDRKVVYVQKKLTQEELLDGIPENKAEEMAKELHVYTGDKWKDADEKTIEEFIEKSPIVSKELLCRGIHVKKDIAEKMLKDAETGVMSFGRVTSWSNKVATGMAFAANDDNNEVIGDDEVPIFLCIQPNHSRTAVPISPFAKYKEEECIMSGKCGYSVVSVAESSISTGHMSKPFIKGYVINLMERGEEYDNP